MKKIRRYSMQLIDPHSEPNCQMCECHNGDFVYYDDVEEWTRGNSEKVNIPIYLILVNGKFHRFFSTRTSAISYKRRCYRPYASSSKEMKIYKCYAEIKSEVK